MPRSNLLVVKDTHKALLYEDGVLAEILETGRYYLPRTTWYSLRPAPSVEVVMVDMRDRERAVIVYETQTAEGIHVSASFVLRYRVVDPRAAIHEVKDFEDRLASDVQIHARRLIRSQELETLLAQRNLLGDEIVVELEAQTRRYGVEILSIEIKDLSIPEELKNVMVRLAYAKHLSQAQHLESRLNHRGLIGQGSRSRANSGGIDLAVLDEPAAEPTSPPDEPSALVASGLARPTLWDSDEPSGLDL